MRLIAGSLVLLTGIGAAVALRTWRAEVDACREIAASSYSEARYDLARRWATRGLTADPSDRRCRQIMARASGRLDRNEACLRRFESLGELEAEDEIVRGLIFVERDLFNPAVVAFKRARELGGDSPEICRGLIASAEFLRLSGLRLQEAERLLQYPGHELVAHTALAFARYQASQYREAAEHFDWLIRERRDLDLLPVSKDELFLSAAICFRECGENAKLAATLSRIEDIETKALARSLRGQFRVASGEKETGLIDLRLAHQAYPAHPWIARYLAEALLNDNLAEEALEVLENSRKIAPREDPGLMTLLNSVRFRLGKDPLPEPPEEKPIPAATENSP
jgi:tetratricopeptide (TPR) repeat protein